MQDVSDENFLPRNLDTSIRHLYESVGIIHSLIHTMRKKGNLFYIPSWNTPELFYHKVNITIFSDLDIIGSLWFCCKIP